jgi:hypothetical protein
MQQQVRQSVSNTQIIGDNSEEFEDSNNPVLNLANITSEANHLAEGDTTDSLENRAKN